MITNPKKTLRVVHVGYRCGRGGAHGAAWRIHQGLLDASVESFYYCAQRTFSDPRVYEPHGYFARLLQTKVIPRIEAMIARRVQPHPDQHSLNMFPSSVAKDVRKLNPDVVHLHWVGKGMLRPEALTQFECPVVWTLHDLWPILGSEHYFIDSLDYQNVYTSNRYKRLSLNINRWLMKRKMKAYAGVKLKVVGNSNWVTDCARRSPAVSDNQVKTILYSINASMFRPRNRRFCRELFEVEEDALVILFGANTLKNPRKGFDLLLSALQGMPSHFNGRRVLALVFGPQIDLDLKAAVSVQHVGYISDQRLLSVLYNTADVMVTPSRKEAFGLTCLEALACGTPVVAFKTGGFLDQIEHMHNGWLAEVESVESLRTGIETILGDDNLRKEMQRNAVKIAQNRFSTAREVEQYINTYHELLKST